MNNRQISSNNLPVYRLTGGILKSFFYLSVLTVSFDVFLVVHLGFNFRATQVFLLVPMFIVMARMCYTKTLILPVGFSYLLVWTLFIFAFIPNTVFLIKSIGYAFWLLFDVFLILATVQIFNTETKINNLIRWYVYSFFFVAVFGLIQFTMPILHLGAPFVWQWWVPGVVPRINGFSYEASFFATYMLMGWVFSAFLLSSGSLLISRKRLKIIFITITLVMILCSSRMGWLMMSIWLAQYPVRTLYHLLIIGSVSRKSLSLTVKAVCFPILVLIVGISVIGMDNFQHLFVGLGLSHDSGSWSADTRLHRMQETFQIFLNSPIIGYSLGGLSSAIGALHGVLVNNFALGKVYEGNSVFVGVLAASGAVGVIPFILYIYSILRKPLRLAKRVDYGSACLLIGMVMALVFELIILQFNQVILRPYLWLHIAILSALYSVCANKRYLRIGEESKEFKI